MEDQNLKDWEKSLGQSHLRELRNKYLLVEEQVFCQEKYFYSKLVLYFVNYGRFDEKAIFTINDTKKPGILGPELKSGVINYFQTLENLITVERLDEKSFLAAISDPERETYGLGLSKYTLDYLAKEKVNVDVINLIKK